MAKANDTKRKTAQQLYVEAGWTQLEIAELFNVNVRTVNTWSQDGDWKKLRVEFQTKPEQIEQNLTKRIATLSEWLNDESKAEGFSKYANEIAQLNKTVITIRKDGNYSLIVYIRVLDELTNHVRINNPELLQSLAPVISHFTQLIAASKES